MSYAQPWSSSTLSRPVLPEPDAIAGPDAPEPVHGQYGGGGPCCSTRPAMAYGEPFLSHFAWEAGGGFTTPLAGAANSVNTAWNVKVGAGYNFNSHFALLGEYGFSRFGLTDSVLVANDQYDGNVHLWSITGEPVFRVNPHNKLGFYLIGGGGVYHVLTSFTVPSSFNCLPIEGCYDNGNDVVTSRSTSTQPGANVGGGVTFKTSRGGRLALYGEGRWEWIDTPGHASEIAPVTIGLRF